MAVPTEDEQAEVLKLIREIYGQQWENAKSASEKQALAKDLLKAGFESKSRVERFAMLNTANYMAVLSGDAETAMRAIEELAQGFKVDEFKLSVAAADKLAMTALSVEQKKAALQFVRQLNNEALTKDRFQTSTQLGQMSESLARSIGDLDLTKEVIAENRQNEQVVAAFAKIAEAQKRLEKSPENPADNLVVGQFYCFTKGDWEYGLPMLALGNDKKLKTLAIKELQGHLTLEQRVDLADAWWDLAEVQEQVAQGNMRQRARLHYRQVLPNVSGLLKDKVARRLGDATPNVPANEPVPKTPRLIDLLELVETSRDIVTGGWEIRGGELISDDTWEARLRLPYLPPAEYDFQVEYTRLGTDKVSLIMSARNVPLMWATGHGTRYCGFEMIDGKNLFDNQTRLYRIEAAHNRYAWTVKVRKNGVAAFLNGQLMSQYKSDFSDFGLWDGWKLGDDRALGVGSISPTVFHVIRVQEIGEAGTLIQKSSCIRDRLALITRPEFSIPKTGLVVYPIHVPKLQSNSAILDVAVENMYDDVGDGGMYANLLDERRKLVKRWFSRSEGWEHFQTTVKGESDWFLVLEDRDTRFTGKLPGNKGSIRVILMPKN